jgi:anti-sigma regulatory factor (Ser/Thr protein kinase)
MSIFSNEPLSPADARRSIAALLEGYPAGVVDDARLLVTELVANAIAHAHGVSIFAAEVRDGSLRVRVVDKSPHLPARMDEDRDRDRGRGLLILDRLATSWRVERCGSGKVVAFELQLPAI